MKHMIGIDLGTTNSCVAVLEGGKPIIIPNAEGGRTTPSVVAFTKDGERLVGELAKRQAVTNAAGTISSIKREMGTDYRVDIAGRKRTPQEISAMILQKLKADAEAYLGEPVTDAVITVPAGVLCQQVDNHCIDVHSKTSVVETVLSLKLCAKPETGLTFWIKRPLGGCRFAETLSGAPCTGAGKTAPRRCRRGRAGESAGSGSSCGRRRPAYPRGSG